MPSQFLKKTSTSEPQCFCCGSTLLRRNKKGDVYCFLCGAGDNLPQKAECSGLEFEEVLQIVGREPGRASQIIARINTPGTVLSHVRFDEREIEIIRAYVRGFE